MGCQLIDRNFGSGVNTSSDDPFNEDGYYRLIEDDESNALNAGPLSECVPQPASKLGESLRKLILKLYSDHITEKGVNYNGLKEDEAFSQYLKLTKELQRVDISKTSQQERTAFFINIYNALVIHGNIARGHPSNVWQRYKFFNTVQYIIGGKEFSLQDIENGVLRANRKGVGMFRKPFGPDDPRLDYALDECQPLIHFALNCGAKSCPPIKTFSAKGLKNELKVAAEAFLETDEAIRFDHERNKVAISMIFKWYRVDFGENDKEVLEYLRDLLAADSEKKKTLAKAIDNGYAVTHIPYDWGNNSS